MRIESWKFRSLEGAIPLFTYPGFNDILLKDPIFLLIGISNVFGMMGFYTPFVYLPNMAAQYVSYKQLPLLFVFAIH